MKRLIFSILICALALGVKAQEMDALFISMPDQNIPQLENAWRKDLVDLYKSGKDATLKNTMNGSSSLKKLTSDYLLLQATERSSIEMKLLPLVNNTNVICMIRTVNGPVADSQIEFFTTEWQPLAVSDLFTPVDADWFIKDDTDKNSNAFQDAASRLDMDLIQYTLSPDNLTLTATYTTPLYLSKEDRKAVIPFIKESPKVYTWEKYHFK
ncbi:DUF3256 family protein [uncultured Parabacteroides sp.]|jgi:hypothetical protein|uniref:DUF3256 family protein n=1 Tax=uncultured Parabacteroides sp. TaxID=512312 RepID=UPI0025DA0195|nr:DUF3256 family protein [uncultured Parabacteroides sp.]